MDIDQDERGLTQKEIAMARQTAKEIVRSLYYEAGKSLIQKVVWSIIMAALGFGAHHVWFSKGG